MLATQDEYERALQRVATDRAVEARMRAGWARQGLAPALIDTIMEPVRRVHAEDAAAVHAYEQQLAQGGLSNTAV